MLDVAPGEFRLGIEQDGNHAGQVGCGGRRAVEEARVVAVGIHLRLRGKVVAEEDAVAGGIAHLVGGEHGPDR